MKRACLLVVLFLLAIQPTDLGGQDLAARDGNALLHLCALALEPNAAGDGRAGVCIGMVAAVTDLAEVRTDVGPGINWFEELKARVPVP